VLRRALLLAALALLARAGDDRPARRLDGPLQTRINEAIARGIAALRAAQTEEGSWGVVTARSGAGRNVARQLHHESGYTALALYALSASGVPADDPAIRRGLAWAEEHADSYDRGNPVGTYCVSLLVLALTRIDPQGRRARIHELAGRIERSQLPGGLWTYALASSATPSRARPEIPGRKPPPEVAPSGRGDGSNTQFAILALWAAQALAGFEPERTQVWEKAEKLYRRRQSASTGGWGYLLPPQGSGEPVTRSMTASGLVGLVYAIASLAPGPDALPRARADAVVQRGLRCFRTLAFEPLDFYYAYSVERVGTVLDLPLAEWYVEGAGRLVDAQEAEGGWAPYRGGGAQPYETSLALLFLSRATRSVVTTPDRAARPRGPVTADEFPDPAAPGGLARAFDYYVAARADVRDELAARFGPAGLPAIAHCVAALRDASLERRTAAIDLLGRLVEKRFLFEAAFAEADREVMLVPIEEFLAREAPALRWDPSRRRFVR